MARKKIDRKDKKLHREFVWLAASEYAHHLCELLGKEKTEWWIDELNLALGSKGDPYMSHYYTIMNWARRSKTSPRPPSVVSHPSSEADAARAADRIISALRDPANKILPSFEEKTKAALFAVLTRRRIRWPELFEMRHDTTYMEEIHADIIKEYK